MFLYLSLSDVWFSKLIYIFFYLMLSLPFKSIFILLSSSERESMLVVDMIMAVPSLVSIFIFLCDLANHIVVYTFSIGSVHFGHFGIR